MLKISPPMSSRWSSKIPRGVFLGFGFPLWVSAVFERAYRAVIFS
nr:MAG TPA: hypothetical protein [Caudoviricetes sp.]